MYSFLFERNSVELLETARFSTLKDYQPEGHEKTRK